VRRVAVPAIARHVLYKYDERVIHHQRIDHEYDCVTTWSHRTEHRRSDSEILNFEASGFSEIQAALGLPYGPYLTTTTTRDGPSFGTSFGTSSRKTMSGLPSASEGRANAKASRATRSRATKRIWNSSRRSPIASSRL
jgi:hypothetical protein